MSKMQNNKQKPQKRSVLLQNAVDDIRGVLGGALSNNFSEDFSEVKKGVRPEGNQQRNLDRETGGVEVKINKEKDTKDVWDERGEEIKKMNEDEQALNNASSSATRPKAFIHADKQRRQDKEEKKERGESAATGYVAKVTQWRQNKEDSVNRGDDGGRVM